MLAGFNWQELFMVVGSAICYVDSIIFNFINYPVVVVNSTAPIFCDYIVKSGNCHAGVTSKF